MRAQDGMRRTGAGLTILPGSLALIVSAIALDAAHAHPPGKHQVGGSHQAFGRQDRIALINLSEHGG